MALNNRLSDIITNFNTLNNSQNNTLNKLSTIDSNLNILTTNLSINQTNGLLVYDKNISTAFDNENDALKVNIVSGTITDAEGKAYLYNGTGDTAITSTALTASINGIDTAAALYSTNGTTRTAITSTASALDVNIKTQTINRMGSFNNFLSNVAINANTNSSSFNIDGYSINSVLSYTDTQNLTDSLLIFASLDNTNFFYYGELLPLYNSSLSKRFALTNINLAPVKYIRLFNTSSTNITAASSTILSS